MEVEHVSPLGFGVVGSIVIVTMHPQRGSGSGQLDVGYAVGADQRVGPSVEGALLGHHDHARLEEQLLIAGQPDLVDDPGARHLLDDNLLRARVDRLLQRGGRLDRIEAPPGGPGLLALAVEHFLDRLRVLRGFGG